MEWGRKTCSGCIYIHATQLSLLEVSLLSSLMSQKRILSHFKATIFIYMFKENKTEEDTS